MKSLGSCCVELAVFFATVFVLVGTGADRAHVKADDAQPMANESSVIQQTVPQFSAMKLRDPSARWVVTIAVASDIAGIKPGDVVDFLVIPEDRAEHAPDQERAPGGPDARLPGPAQILQCLSSADDPFAVEATREDVRIVIDRVDRLEDPRFFPMVGMAQLHRQRFRCTVHSRKTIRSDWPVPVHLVEQASENVHIESNRLLAVVDAKPVADNVQVVGVTNEAPGRQNGDRLIVAVTPRQAIRLNAARSSGLVVIRR
jgi:hypothetical protein